MCVSICYINGYLWFLIKSTTQVTATSNFTSELAIVQRILQEERVIERAEKL